MARLDSLSVT